MSLLSYHEICELIERGVIKNTAMNHVNGSSLDLVLGDEIMIERADNCPILMTDKNAVLMRSLRIDGYFALQPAEFILAHTVESFALPLDISAEYMLKSTQARNGLEHLGAGWCDAGWSGVLTLEFKNMLRHHDIILRPGMKCGQMKFFKHAPVPLDKSYATQGQYNGDTSVSAGKGLK